MFSTLKKRIKNEKGLSLVELLAVIVILGIVAAIAVPAIGNIINNSRDKGEISDALSIISGGKLAHLEHQCGVDGCTGDDLAEFVDGKDLGNISVQLNENNEWVINNYEFNERNAETFDGSPTEMDLKAALDGEGEE